jgi:uncharacterized protein YdaU (DUF1376 family)
VNYYPHHIGDFVRETARLKDSQCMAYLRMIWMYYESESPLENDPDAIAFKIGADASDVQQILKHFFFLHEDGMWHQARCDEEILLFRSKSKKAKDSANARWNNANAMRPHSDRTANASVSDANQEPVTKNQEPKDKTIPDADASSSSPDVEDPKAKADPIPYSAIVDLYHTTGLPRVQVLTAKRKAAVRQRHASLFSRSLQSWEAYFQAVSRSDFLMGRVPGKDWRADFDFLIREDSAIKILEGKYHGSNQRGNGSEFAAPRLTAAQRIAAKRQHLAAETSDVGVVAAYDRDVRPSLGVAAGRGSQ